MKVIRKPSDGEIQLTPNYRLCDFIDSQDALAAGIDNTPDPLAVVNIVRCARVLERVTKALGGMQPEVLCGFQSVALQQYLGTPADHLRGESVDIDCPDFGTLVVVYDTIVAAELAEIESISIERAHIHITVKT